MARRTLVALLTLMVVVTPAHAQTEQVLLDTTLGVVPESTTTVCPVLPAGLLAVSLRTVGKAKPNPITFSFYGWRRANGEANTERSVTNDELIVSAPLKGGRYCITLRNDAIASPSAGLAEVTSLRQDVVIKVTLTPQ